MRNNAILRLVGPGKSIPRPRRLPTKLVSNAVEAAIPGFLQMSTPTPRGGGSSGSCRWKRQPADGAGSIALAHDRPV